MSVKKEASGRRSVQVEVEVPGTPEQVWEAIASGPGISAWFVPTTVEGKVGGTLSCDFGGGMVTASRITEWQPPMRMVAEDDSWLQGGPTIATEWTVEAKGGGTCVVRVVHSLFASTDEWDGQIEHTETGWPGYFRVLRFYLENYAGQPAASFVGMAPTAQSKAEIWQRLVDELGGDPEVAQQVELKPAGLVPIAGKVRDVDDLPQGRGVTVALDQPNPGILMLSAMDCMGMQMATLQVFFYGDGAKAAAAEADGWCSWLTGMFPPPPPPPEEA